MTKTEQSRRALLTPQRAKARVRQSLTGRRRTERLFRSMGLVSVAIGVSFVAILLIAIGSRGAGGFVHTFVKLDVDLSHASLGLSPEDPDESVGNYRAAIRNAIRTQFPDVAGRRDLRNLQRLLSNGAEFLLREQVMDDPDLIGSNTELWVPADDDVHLFLRESSDLNTPVEGVGRINDQQREWLKQLKDDGRIDVQINTRFFYGGDSRDPELAGIGGAAVGSLLTLLVTLLLSFPIGVSAAIYLEEFAPRNRATDLIEVTINNLAAVPSIIFGLLGLAVFINFFGLPRSAPLVGGLVLALMTLPTIIIASRAALRAVPPSIREAAYGLGASRMQTVFHHVVPLAMPGMMTGTIIGMAQALGETAPLLMIGMVAFIVDVPQGITDPATTLPVQIYLWADSPERAFVEKTSAAILVLLAFLACMNAFAVWLRARLERRW